MKAKELMIPSPEYLHPDDTLRTAVNLLRTARRDEDKLGTKGLPVLDENSKLVGMLSMADILRAVFPFYMGMMELGEFSWDGMVEEVAAKSEDKHVDNVMSKNVITVNEDASLMECIDHMLKNRIKRLPVLNKEGRVVGMLYERDVFFAVTKAMLEKEGGAIE
ncbi:MAG: CBS domain-containing protein [Candidatus Aquicultor sp.]|nr:CBS domain-containing protein [Candidatus Aquicultor sp.]